MDLPKGLVCFWCKAVYQGRPSNHVCPDGSTFLERVSRTGQVGGNVYHYGDDSEVDAYNRKLTSDDIAWLRKQKIKVD